MIERIKTGHLEQVTFFLFRRLPLLIVNKILPFQRKHMLTMRSTIAALERTELQNAAAVAASKAAAATSSH